MDQEKKPIHRAFMDHLRAEGVQYSEMNLGSHHILYDFEPREKLSADAIARLIADYRRKRWG